MKHFAYTALLTVYFHYNYALLNSPFSPHLIYMELSNITTRLGPCFLLTTPLNWNSYLLFLGP